LYQQTNSVKWWHLSMAIKNRYKIANQTVVREMNLAAIMDQLHKRAPISRAALAQETGLNKTTVSSLVQELIEHHFVAEVGLNSAGTGRPAVLLEFNPTAGCIVSAEIGVDFILVICTNFVRDIIWRHKEAHAPHDAQSSILDRMQALLQQAIEIGTRQCGPLLGIALGLPGLIDQDSGTLLLAPNLGWQNVPIRQIISKSFNAPIFLNNEANLAVLGEFLFGVAQGHSDVLYVSAGVGLGGGMIHQGQLFNGGTGLAGEFGHMTMDPNGWPCNCGNIGCWETQVSQSALFRYVADAILTEGRSSHLTELAGGKLDALTVVMVAEAAHNGDSVALESLDKVGRHLGIGIASLVNALNPQLVVFGGILSLVGEFLLPTINGELHRRALRWTDSAAKVVLARHGVDACVMGGVATVYQSILARPTKTVN
jgi:glucokinase-like ROK family protein